MPITWLLSLFKNLTLNKWLIGIFVVGWAYFYVTNLQSTVAKQDAVLEQAAASDKVEKEAQQNNVAVSDGVSAAIETARQDSVKSEVLIDKASKNDKTFYDQTLSDSSVNAFNAGMRDTR